MKEISGILDVNPSDFCKRLSAPANRERTRANFSPISALADPAVQESMADFTKNQRTYLLRFLRYVSEAYPKIASLRKELGYLREGHVLPIFSDNDPDTPSDMTILKTLFPAGLFRSMGK